MTLASTIQSSRAKAVLMVVAGIARYSLAVHTSPWFRKRGLWHHTPGCWFLLVCKHRRQYLKVCFDVVCERKSLLVSPAIADSFPFRHNKENKIEKEHLLPASLTIIRTMTGFIIMFTLGHGKIMHEVKETGKRCYLNVVLKKKAIKHIQHCFTLLKRQA